MLARDYCDQCGKRTLRSRLVPVLIHAQTHSSPAEYESWCRVCCLDPDYVEEMRSLRRYSDEERERI